MICDNCGKKEAIIAYTKMDGSETEIIHLCAECAEKKMREDLSFNNAVTGKMESFLKEIFKLTGNFENKNLSKKCKYCGSTFKDLEDENLGCSHCYDEFKDEINSMIKNLRNYSRYIGKIPKSAGDEVVDKRELYDLQNQLAVAIGLENYEEAAQIRDEIKKLRAK